VWSNAARESGTGQAKAVAARCLQSIGEDRPGPARIAFDGTGGHARRRLRVRPFSGHHLHSGADVVRHQERTEPRQASQAVSEGSRRVRAGHATALTKSGAPTGDSDRRGDVLATAGSTGQGSARARGGRRASLGDRASRWARLAASVWLLRCLSPRSDEIATPGLKEHGLAVRARTGGFRPRPTWAMAAAGPSEVCAASARPPPTTLDRNVPRINS
jgi:hypothetical protein